MITRLLIAGVAVAALTAGAASAHKTHHRIFHRTRTLAYAMPAQPIPYAQLDHYLKASPRERKSIEMAAANTGATANTAATTTDTAAAPAAASDTAAPAPASPPAATPDNTSVNPPSAPNPGAGGPGTGSSANDTGPKPQPQ